MSDTADIKTETPAAVETLTAAAKLRQLLAAVPAGRWTLHEDLIQRSSGTESAIVTDARGGMDALVLSGEWWGEGLAVMRLLVALHAAAEPLADLLEEIQRQQDMPPCDDPSGVCNNCDWRPDFVIADALAAALNGDDRG